MKQTKLEKGITLIALIITIIVLLILAVAAISAVRDSDIITYAKDAVSATEMAEIREQAELTKSELFMESKMNSDVIVSKQVYLERLEEKFTGRCERAYDISDVLIIDGIYAVSITNLNFDVEVREYNGLKTSELLTLPYDLNITKKNEAINEVLITLNLKAVMTAEQYKTMMEKYEKKIKFEEMEQVVFEEWTLLITNSGWIEPGKEVKINSIGDYTSLFLSYNPDFDTILVDENGERTKHDTIEEWAADEEFLEKLQVESITPDELNAALNGYDDYEEFIEEFYNSNIKESTDYKATYKANTQKLSFYINNELIKENITAGIDEITLTEYFTDKNETIEFVIKNQNKEIVAFEKITINCCFVLEDNNLYVEAGGEWITDGNGKITGYTGVERKITVPMYVGDECITSIDSNLFKGSTSLVSIKIPNSVTKIEDNAFRSCSNLKNVELPEKLTSIGVTAFYECKALTEIDFPDSLTSIGDSAFSGCTNLTSITIPDSVNSIGREAFSRCISVTSITIPDSVTSISGGAFSTCTSVTSIIIPDSVTSIGDGAFGYCKSLSNITIPNSVTSIDDRAFCGCSSLSTITIPNSVTSIGDAAFQECSSLSSITIPNLVTGIGDSAFWACSSLSSITIPDSVTSIGDYAFQNCKSLNNIIIPDSVKTIGIYAFWNCSSLSSITIPDSVTSIGSKAFYGCTVLTEIIYNKEILKTGYPWGAPNL